MRVGVVVTSSRTIELNLATENLTKAMPPALLVSDKTILTDTTKQDMLFANPGRNLLVGFVRDLGAKMAIVKSLQARGVRTNKLLRAAYASAMTQKKLGKQVIGVDYCMAKLNEVRSETDPAVLAGVGEHCTEKMAELGIPLPGYMAAALGLMCRAPAVAKQRAAAKRAAPEDAGTAAPSSKRRPTAAAPSSAAGADAEATLVT